MLFLCKKYPPGEGLEDISLVLLPKVEEDSAFVNGVSLPAPRLRFSVFRFV